jgi:hypothetical protein
MSHAHLNINTALGGTDKSAINAALEKEIKIKQLLELQKSLS